MIVSAPPFTSEKEIKTLLKSKEEWIRNHLHRYSREKEALNPLNTIFYHGQKLNVVSKTAASRKRLKVSFSPEKGICRLEGPETSPELKEKALKIALVKKAKETLTERLRELSRQTEIPIDRVIIRNQKTRWGSSSSKGNISINWRAVMLAPEVQDYLLIHELCHQKHFNHSRTYWDSLAVHCPDYKNLNHQLGENQGFMNLFR